MGTDYFRLHPFIGILSNLPVLIGAAALLLLGLGRFRRELERRPGPWIGGVFVVTRLVFVAVMVIGLRHVSLDLSTYFQTQGAAALRGLLPYRDFGSSYGPLFPYLMTLPSLLRGPLPFFLFFIACDLVALVALMRMARNEGGPSLAVRAGWLYTAAPVTWYFLVRYGQDEALAAAFLAVAALLLKTGRETGAAVLLGLGFVATKFTFGIFIPGFLIAARRPVRFALVTGGVLAAVLIAFVAAGAPVWRPLVGESGALGFGPSLWRLPIVFTPLVAGWPMTVLLALALAVLWIGSSRSSRGRNLERVLLLTAAVFLVLSPKVMPMYLTPFWPFASLWIARWDRPADYVLAAVLNVLLGTWWYFDAGGIQGQFGPVVQWVAIALTAAIPIAFVVLFHQVRTKPEIA